jgi:hypothetical protein
MCQPCHTMTKKPGFVVVTNLDAYDDATEAFRKGGSRDDLLISLGALGVAADVAKWHAARRGNRMVVCQASSR